MHLLLEVDWVTRLGSVVLFEDFHLIRSWWVGGGWKVHSALWRVGEVGGAILIRGSVTLPCKMSEDVRWLVH